MAQTVTVPYQVLGDADVTVHAGIGDGQAGGHSLFLGRDLVAHGEITAQANLGRGADLVGRVLVVSSIAVDVLPATDKVSVLVTLTGGHPDPLGITRTAEVAAGSAESFITIVRFA